MTASNDQTKEVVKVLLAGNKSAEANIIITKVEAWRVSLFFNIIYFQIQIAIAVRILTDNIKNAT